MRWDEGPWISLYTYCHLCNAATFKGWAGPTLHEARNLRAQLRIFLSLENIFSFRKHFSTSENIFHIPRLPMACEDHICWHIVTTWTQIGLGKDLTFLLLLFMINRFKLDHNFNNKLAFYVKVMECYKITHLWWGQLCFK